MTSRFALTTPIENLRQIFSFSGGMAYPPRHAIAPTEPVAVIRLKPGVEATGARELALVRWGLIPHWVKDPGAFATLVTARAETVLDKPSFKIPMRHRRCIVPADAFYAWSGTPRSKVAYRVTARLPGPNALAGLSDRAPRPMALAGLWDHWLGADGSEIDTLVLVTVPANAELRPIGERMPALLFEASVDAWLDVRGTSHEAAAARLKAAPDGSLDVARVADAAHPSRTDIDTSR